MKLRQLRRIRVRHWDTVHKSGAAVLEDNVLWPTRTIKPCTDYNPWCSNCNSVRFKLDFGRFPRNVDEFYAFEDKVQAEAS